MSLALADDVELLAGEDVGQLMSLKQHLANDPPEGTSQGGRDRCRRAVAGEGMLEHHRHQVSRHASCCCQAQATVLSTLVRGQAGFALVRSITASRSLRAVIFCMDLLGSLVLATALCSASGGGRGRRRVASPAAII
ncbi:unnamed protein product [Prorocentrum cordatum]|uniref:Uncharacterized protein n=1 Tax=Prorocentrum cordatum TaxID=2364126 RepID=A0ABN9T0J8_9DINO|nr:unnamed protein product [Polarella glacialis]|mmetsp:Transcript_104901/g.281929  ORF Transcript_104901/g.281929 Transcript_104901/m.281929 type:complete len:137 (-) Transcript_104901:307-717(-)